MIARKMNSPDLAIFTPTLDGGVGRVIYNLSEELVRRNIKLDIVVTKLTPDSYRIEGANVIELGIPRTFKALPALVRYFRHARPTATLSVIYHANIIAVLAKFLSLSKTRLVLSEHIAIKQALAQEKKPLRLVLRTLIRLCYPRAHKIVCVSIGAAKELTDLGIPEKKITVIYNPVVSPQMLEDSSQTVNHPWLTLKTEPVIVAIGRLTFQKDFRTLIEAFALVRQKLPCKLLILGDGPDKRELNELIRQLGLKSHIELLGQVANPYPFLKQASLFVLSSRHEGLPTVLIEALALNKKIVSTDCPHGPKEILEDGKFGTLIPVGDIPKMAEAILDQLAAPEPNRPDSAIEPFMQKTAADLYAQLLLK